MSRRRRDPTTEYAEQVLAGDVLACDNVRRACQRHIDDLRHQAKKKLRWELELALSVIDFFPTLKLDNGQEFVLEPFQEFIIGSIFGWYNRNGTRRFRTAYIEIGKGNGKSPLAAGVGLYCLIGDGEPRAEVYSAAVSREQARIVFDDAQGMAISSEVISDLVELQTNYIKYFDSASNLPSYFRPVSSEHRGLDGKRVHAALIDELHEHHSSMVADKMRAGTKTRPNAIVFEITNSGYDRASVCWDHHVYSQRILQGKAENDAWFAYVCGLDTDDDFTDESVWVKSNPGLDTILPREYLRELVREAVGMPSKENIVKRLNFCVWTEQSSGWMPTEWWDQCAERHLPPIEHLRGELGFAGLKLAISRDISTLVLVIPKGGKFFVYPWFWCPSSDVRLRSDRDGAPYDQWARQPVAGAHTPVALIETEGDAPDFPLIENAVANTFQRFGIRFGGLLYDATSSSHMATRLVTEHGLDEERVIRVNKTFTAQTEATEHVERIFKAGDVVHGNNPVLRRMFQHVAVKRRNVDPYTGDSEVMVDRSASGEVVSGMEALVIAMVGWVKHLKEEEENEPMAGAVLW